VSTVSTVLLALILVQLAFVHRTMRRLLKELKAQQQDEDAALLATWKEEHPEEDEPMPARVWLADQRRIARNLNIAKLNYPEARYPQRDGDA